MTVWEPDWGYGRKISVVVGGGRLLVDEAAHGVGANILGRQDVVPHGEAARVRVGWQCGRGDSAIHFGMVVRRGRG